MNNRTQSQKASLYKATALLLLVFVSGAATGAALMRLLYAPRAPRTDRVSPMTPPGLEDLGLTKEQQRKAHEIGEKYRPQLEAIRKEIAPRVEKIHGKMQRELFAILTPAQRRAHGKHMGPPAEGHHIAPPAGPGAPPPHGRTGHGPPRQALRACHNRKSGAPCSFASPRGETISGVCHLPPGSTDLSCRPSFH